MRNYFLAYWLFIRIVWRDFHGARITWSSAWEVSKQIHLRPVPEVKEKDNG